LQQQNKRTSPRDPPSQAKRPADPREGDTEASITESKAEVATISTPNLDWLRDVPPELEECLSPLEKIVLRILRRYAEEEIVDEQRKTA